jgi:hypothetical protein
MQRPEREDPNLGTWLARVVRAVLAYDVSSQVCTRVWRVFSTLLLSLITALLLNIGGRIAETVVLVRAIPVELAAINRHLGEQGDGQRAQDVRLRVVEKLVDRLMDTTTDILRIESGAHPGAYRDVPRLDAPGSRTEPPR